jgi:hypothetical protein
MADRYAIVENGVVVNVVVAEEAPRNSVLVTGLRVNPGDLYNGSTFTERPLTEEEIASQRAAEIRSELAKVLTALQTIIDSPQVTFSNIAGAQTASRQLQQAIKTEASILRRVVRLTANQLDGTS